MSLRRRHALAVLLATLTLAASGCGGGVDTTYGRQWSRSVNGTSVMADLLRQRGHTVRSATRLTDELQGWADVIVRFAQAPGPIAREEADWYSKWLAQNHDRSLVYIPEDYNAEAEYWDRALEQLPANATQRTRDRVKEARLAVQPWEKFLGPPTTKPAPAAQWFAVEAAKPSTVCKKLTGLWAKEIDPARAALTVHQALKVDAERVLLTGDGKTLVMDWDLDNGGRVLVVASGVFLLNLPLTEPARWPLAVRTAEWIEGDESDDSSRHTPRKIAFVEGSWLSGSAAAPSVFALLRISPFTVIMPQFLVLGLVVCLARAPRLGRARPDDPSDADRPVAHPEALGALLARTGRASEAHALLDAYRRWRTGGRVAALTPPSPSDNPYLTP
jgi:hypothetical protein